MEKLKKQANEIPKEISAVILQLSSKHFLYCKFFPSLNSVGFFHHSKVDSQGLPLAQFFKAENRSNYLKLRRFVLALNEFVIQR